MAMVLHQDINDLALLLDGSPQIVLLTPNFDDNFIEIPLVSEFRTTTNLISVDLSKLETSFADSFIGDLNVPIQHHFLNISKAEREGVVQPNAVSDDLGRDAVSFIGNAYPLNVT